MTRIFYITPIDHLALIAGAGGLWCDRRVSEGALASVSIAHADIKAKRRRKFVPKGPGGVVADYVPFYFAPRSPMLYALHMGRVASFEGSQEDIVHLVSTAEDVARADLPFVFTDGHAIMALTEFFTSLDDLSKVDWSVMTLTYWHDTENDNDRTRRRQAEFLVREFLPWQLIKGIGVRTQSAEARVREALGSQCPPLRVKPDWYY